MLTEKEIYEKESKTESHTIRLSNTDLKKFEKYKCSTDEDLDQVANQFAELAIALLRVAASTKKLSNETI